MGVRSIAPPNHYIVFDGQNLADWGVHISGADSFGSPDRDTKNVDIPGRDGSLTQDNGRFKNYTLKYKASIVGKDEEDFRQKIDKLRSWLASKYSYCRLEDTYHIDEYRLAKWVGGLDPDVIMLQGGNFDLEFDCKPQRFLKLGEKPVQYGGDGAIINNTDFTSKPTIIVHLDDTGAGNVVKSTATSSDKQYATADHKIGTTDFYYYTNSQNQIVIISDDSNNKWTLPAGREMDEVLVAAIENAYSSLTYYRDELNSWKDYMTQTVKDILGQFTIRSYGYSATDADFDVTNMAVSNLLTGTETYYYYKENGRRVILSEDVKYVFPDKAEFTRDQAAMACISIKSEIAKAKDQLQSAKVTLLTNTMKDYSESVSGYKADDPDFMTSNFTSDNQIGSTNFYYFKTLDYEEVDTYIDPTSSDEDKRKKEEEIRHKQEEVEAKRVMVVVSKDYNRKWKIGLKRTDITKDTFVDPLTKFESKAKDLETRYSAEYASIAKKHLGIFTNESIKVESFDGSTSSMSGAHKVEGTDDFYLYDPASDTKNILLFWDDVNVPLKFTLPLESYISGRWGSQEYILAKDLADEMDNLKAVRKKYKEEYSSYYDKLMDKALTRFGEFSIDNEIIAIRQHPKSIAAGVDSIYIDCDMMDCYNDALNCNDLVRFARNTFPQLKPGENKITIGDGIESIEIIPRWYTI